MVIGVIDETGQEKVAGPRPAPNGSTWGAPAGSPTGSAPCTCRTCGMKAGHALIGARRAPSQHIADLVKSGSWACHGSEFRTKGQRRSTSALLRTPTASASISPAGTRRTATAPSCASLRGQQPGVRAARAVELHPHPGRGHENDLAQAVKALLKDKRRWEIRSAGHGSKGQRWYAWAWVATASPRHHLLVRHHLKTGDLAFHYCDVPGGQILTKARLIRAAGLRWPVEEDFEFGKDCFGVGQRQARLYTAIARHAVLVMAALAICAITAALVKDRTDTQAPSPVRADQPPPAEPGMIPLTIPVLKRLLAALTTRPLPRWLVIHWDAWTRRRPRPAPDGSTNAPDSPATPSFPWSASEMRVPY